MTKLYAPSRTAMNRNTWCGPYAAVVLTPGASAPTPTKETTMTCTYAAVLHGRQIEIEAGSLWEAKQIAIERFGARRAASRLIGIYLIRDSQGQPVNIIPQLN